MIALTPAFSATASTMLGLILEVALKGTLLMAAVAAAAFALRGATASLRHLVWSFPLVAMLAIPALSLVVPPWQMGILPLPGVSYPVPGARYPVPVSSRPLADIREMLPIAGDPVPITTVKTAGESQNTSLSLMSALALLWVGGVALGLITIVGGMMTLRRLARRSMPITSGDWETLLTELKADLRITRNVRLLISPSAAMPATWGVFCPIVLLPADAAQWDAERRRVVLLHELAHVKRNDCLMQIIAQLSCTVYWFHPGVWYVATQLRSERELACDEYVLGIGVNACDYAEHLLDIATGFRAPSGSSIAGIAMARPSQLEGRLNAILSEDLTKRFRASRPMRVATLLLLAALTIPLAAMRPGRTAAASTEVVASLSASVSPIAPSDTFHWKGAVPAGQWVEVLAHYGDMRVELSHDSDVEVLAVKKSGDTRNVKIALDRSKRGTRFCAITATASESSRPCQTGLSGGLVNGRSDVRVDFLVKVPAGVGIAVHTGRGNITAESVRSYVWGTSAQGDIRIITTDLAEASTRVGSIFAQFGRRSWKQDLEFLTENGNVTVIAPSNATMMIQVETQLGSVKSEFPGQLRRFGSGQRIVTTVRNGGGMLTLRTGRGVADLRRGGPAVGETSDMSVSSGDQVDPKPNPNPNPEYDPDPNLNPDVEEMTDATSDVDNPTGERVSVNLPANFVERFRDETIRSWPDARAIGRLRDIAATHVKQHPADLVRERSEWALTLVRNGEIVTPLLNALARSDWRERAYAAWALGETRDPRAADPLTAALRDSHWRVRMHAAAALQRIGGARAVNPLITALADDYWQVRISAIDALAAIGDRRALLPLQRVAERDGRWMVRDQARNAIHQFK